MSRLKFHSTSKVGKAARKAAVVLFSLLLFASAILLLQWTAWGTAQPRPSLASPLSLQEPVTPTLRVYGGSGWPHLLGNMGAGSGVATDTKTALLAEDQPYTDTMAIFDPQQPQAPRKDSLTWNPIFMSEADTPDENQRTDLYLKLLAGGVNAAEKVWFRMWYEPEHWDKDLNANGEFDRDPSTGEPTDDDEWYPAIMQEFTYLLMNLQTLDPTYGQAHQTRIVFPVGMRASDLFTDTWVVDTESENALYGYGLTSLDSNFDDDPDIIYVESEQTLQSTTGIEADFDGDGNSDPLDFDGIPLNGNELVVFRLSTLEVPLGQCLQFLDHLVCVKGVFNYGASVQIWYTGDRVPTNLGSPLVDSEGMVLAGGASTRVIPPGGGNPGVLPPGPFFAYLESVDSEEGTARLMVGRALGATWSAMENIGGGKDLNPGDPWFLKRFYVDGHEYNVVAIRTRGTTEFQFITIRTPIPKVPITIEQHSVRLQHYPSLEPLSVMPPYNYEHYIFKDVQASTAGAIGSLVGPVPPILQKNGPFPYTGIYPAWPVGPYDDPREVYFFYVREDKNPEFLGELKEKYGEYLVTVPVTREVEFWYVEQWWTRPWQYTEFVLPDIQNETDLYLLTSAFFAPTRERVKFWFDPAEGGKKYKGLEGVRLYGQENESAGDIRVVGDEVQTPVTITTAVVEVLPYTDPWDPFNPQLLQAPKMDSLTFNPAYMDRFNHGGESLRDLYSQIFTEVGDAREKVFFRMWYEPAYLDKVLEGSIEPRDEESESEPNDDCAHANLIELDEIMVGSLRPGDEADCYTFGLPAEDIVRIETGAGDHGNGWTDDTRLKLWDDVSCPEDAPLAEDHYSGPGNLAMIEMSLPTDTYYFCVTAEGGADIKDYTVAIYVGDERPIVEGWRFPALMQEFTYMFLDTRDQPSHGQPGSSQLAFPMATASDELPAPDPTTGVLSFTTYTDPARFGYGLTTFDADFDGSHDIVAVHSEQSLSQTTGIQADFDGDGVIDQLDTDGVELSGDELVVFAVKDIILERKESAMFLDHMVTLENISWSPERGSTAELKFWYTAGGIYPIPGGYSLHPDELETRALTEGEMAVLNGRIGVHVISAGGDNLNRTDGAWFAYLKSVNIFSETAVLTIGRALGATHSAIDDGAGGHDMTPGDPWYLKRFFVDGHEYNVVAIKTVPADSAGEDFEFKYVTIRTPVPKENFLNTQDSIKLEGYYQGILFDVVDTDLTSVMPPFNFRHTRVKDIQKLEEKAVPEGETEEEIVFANEDFYDEDCLGEIITEVTGEPLRELHFPAFSEGEDVQQEELVCAELDLCAEDCWGELTINMEGGVSPLEIRIVDEDIEPQFSGELKEILSDDSWTSHSFDTMPNEFTELSLPRGQLYLLTSSWQSDQSWVHYYGCDPANGYFTQDDLHGFNPNIPASNTALIDLEHFFAATVTSTLRVKFWYDPAEAEDIYIGTWEITPTLTATATSNSPVCEGETIELYGEPDGMDSYSWTGPGGFSSTDQNPTRPNATLAMSGTYSLTVTQGSETSDPATTEVIVNENPTATASSNSPVCEWGTIELYGGPSGMAGYHWTGPDGFDSLDQNPTRLAATLAMSGTYTLTVTDSNGCTDTATTDVVVNEKPTATASSNSPVFEGETIQLYGGPNGMDGYSWTGPGGFSSTAQNPTRPSATLAMSGTYTLTVTLGGCTSDPATTEVVVTSEGGPQGWLDPQHSSASHCVTTEVEIWVDAEGFKSGQIKLAYDSNCADVEDWEQNTTDFPLAEWDSDTPGEEWITFSAQESITGTYQVGTLTIHCVSEEECTTALDFVEDGAMTTKLFDDWGSEIPGTWEDGTFACTLGLCGDVAPYPNCDGLIDMGDVSLLHSYVGHPGDYSLCCEWCGDVAPYPDCNGTIDMGDVSLLHSYVGHPGDYHLCCEGGSFAIPASVAPAAAENEVTLLPPDSSALFGETAEVEMWVDATDFKAGQIKLAYDSTCADVMDWVPNDTEFPMWTWDSATAGEEWITFSAEAPMTGTYRIGTLTIHGVSEEGCITVLDFVEDGPRTSKLFDDWGNELSATWADGTFQSLEIYTLSTPAAASDTGYLFSQDVLENHFGSAAMWTGFAPSGADRGKYYGAVQFDLSDLPPEAHILSAEVELAPWPADYLNRGAGGSWTLNLLNSDVDLGWQGKTYWDIAVLASVEDTIGPGLSYDDLGGVNTFTFSEDQIGALEERLGTTGKASFRLDYEATYPFFKDIYGWDGGAPPMLRVTYFVEP